MSYQVHITFTAEHDIMRAADYIEFTSFQGIKNAIKKVDAFLMAMY